jgi:ABC-type dipeptide/oligopeptide/nickel transport system ATPase component
LQARSTALIAMFAAFCFVVMMFNVPVPGGTSGHALGIGIAAAMLGPWPTIMTMSIALTIQALLFGDGGVTTLGVALLFQDPDVQLFCPAVRDEVAFDPLQLPISDVEVNRRVEKALRAFGISHLAERSPHYLSGGEKRRVGLAALFVMDPPVLLLDEPTSGLDPLSQSRLVDLLLD